MARKDKVVKNNVGGVGFLFKKHKVNYVEGTGSLVDANTVEVTRPDGSKQRITTDNVIIATGSVPRGCRSPAFRMLTCGFRTRTLRPGRRRGRWRRANLDLERGGEREVRPGGDGHHRWRRYRLREFAYTYNGLGTKVTILEFLRASSRPWTPTCRPSWRSS
jgi:hypothetical protein